MSESYSRSYSSSTNYSSSESEYDDDIVGCDFCKSNVRRDNYVSHIDNVHHLCSHCNKRMAKRLIKNHIEKMHTVKCKYCSVQIVITGIALHEATHFTQCKYCPSKTLTGNMATHVSENHPHNATIGMIQLQKATDSHFNDLVAQNRIYAKGGFIFIKP